MLDKNVIVKLRLLLSTALLAVVSLYIIAIRSPSVQATTGINQAINFQGKVVNANGTNVTDGTYPFVFNLYNTAGTSPSSTFTESWLPASLWTGTVNTRTDADTITYSTDTNESTLTAGQSLTNLTKSETVLIRSVNTTSNTLEVSEMAQTWANGDVVTNAVYVKDGIFKVALGTLTSIASVDFNNDGIYLGVNFNSDGEMKPLIQFTAVPYAFQAKSVGWSGLTAPTNNLSIGMTSYNSTFTWGAGTGANNLFTLTTDSSANYTGSLLNIQTGASSSVFPLRVRSNTTEALMVDASGNVGIGTTGPTEKLHLRVDQNGSTALRIENQTSGAAAMAGVDIYSNSASGYFRVYDSGVVAPWSDSVFLRAQDTATKLSLMSDAAAGYINFYTGGAAVGNERMRIDSAGNVGIGTTSPLAKLHIAGECVIGETLLPIKRLKRRKKRKNGQEDEDTDDEWENLLIPIKDIQEGDLVASLDEQSGEIVYREIKKLLNKGFQKVVKITTSDGRSIETTHNHPYLTLQAISEKTKWLKVSQLKTGMKIAVPGTRNLKRTFAFVDAANMIYRDTDKNPWKIDLKKLIRYLRERFGVSRVFYFAGVDNRNEKQLKLYQKMKSWGYELRLNEVKNFVNTKGEFYQKADVDARMAFESMKYEDEYDQAVFITGDGDFYWLFEHLVAIKEKVWLMSSPAKTAKELRRLFAQKFINFDDARGIIEFKKDNKKEVDPSNVSTSGLTGPIYQKAKDLSREKIEFVEIAAIVETGRKEVFDIEVEGTHNFIGNDIIAHNTYIKGADQLNTSFSLRTADSTGADKFVITNAGNIGIGTTSPGAKLQIDTGATGTVGQIIKAYSGQTGNLLEFKDSSGNILTRFGEQGYLGIGADPGTGRALYISASNLTYLEQLTGTDVNNGIRLAVTNTDTPTTGAIYTELTANTRSASSNYYAAGQFQNFISSYASETTFNASTGVNVDTDIITLASGTVPATDTPIKFGKLSSETMPTGLADNTTYYVIYVSSSTMQLAATAGGAAIDITGTGSGTIYGWTGESYATTGYVRGLLGSAYTRGLGTYSTMEGLNFAVGHYGPGGRDTMATITNAYIQQNTMYNQPNSTITTAYGAKILFYAQNSGGTWGTIYGNHVTFPTAGTITTMYGNYIAASSVAATTKYGYYVGAMTGATDNYAFYAAGTADKSYFGGNVGIGTTGPAVKLDVVGSIQASSAIRSARGESAGGLAHFLMMTDDATPLSRMAFSLFNVETGSANYGSDFAITTYNDAGTALGTKFVLQRSSGNVGIGTTAPSALLNVAGAANIDGLMKLRVTADAATASRGIELQPSVYNGTQYIRGYGNSGGGGLQLQGYDTGTNLVNSQIFINPSSGASYISFSTGQTLIEQMRITKDGNVGIGTTAPTALLHLGIGSTATIGQKIVLASGATANAFEVNSSTGVGGNLVVMQSNGNVGIGTTGPSEKLEVYGTSGALYARVNSTAAGAAGLKLKNSTNEWLIYNDGTGGDAGYLKFYLGSDRVTFDSSGRVGIGTTNPGNKLAVSGGVGIGTTAANSLYLTTAAPDGGLIVEGNVGIGTTNPGAKVNIVSTSEQLRLGYDNSNYTSFISDAGGNLNINNTGAGIKLGQGSFGVVRSNDIRNLGYGAASYSYAGKALADDNDYLYAVGYSYLTTTDYQWRVEKRSKTTGDYVAGFGKGGIIEENPSSYADEMRAIAVDSSYIYIVGYDKAVSSADEQWRIEKRDITTGALVAAFDTDGIIQINPYVGTSQDKATAVAVDSNYLYVAGFAVVGASDRQWRIEKRDITTGALVAAFDTDGVVESNPSAGTDYAYGMAIDSSYIYVTGQDANSSDAQWRVEKRDITTGALISGFGSSGALSINPSAYNTELVTDVAIDGTYLYLGGIDFTSNDPRWRIEKRLLSDGSLVSAFDSDGVITVNASSGSDVTYGIAVDSNYLYAIGYDQVSDYSYIDQRIEKRDITTGALVSDFGTNGVLRSSSSANSESPLEILPDATSLYAFSFSYDGTYAKWNYEKRDLTTGDLSGGMYFETGGKVRLAISPDGYMSINGNITDSALSVSTPDGLVSHILNLYDGYKSVFDVRKGGKITAKSSIFLGVYLFDGVSTYTYNASEAGTTGGTAFTILADNNDYLYLGNDNQFNTINIDIATALVASGAALSLEYYNGSSWVALDITDSTSVLTTDGVITFDAPGDWSRTAVSSNFTYYYIRLAMSYSGLTTAATAYSIAPIEQNRLELYAQGADTSPSFNIDSTGLVEIANTGNLAATGGTLRLARRDTTATNGDVIGSLQFYNDDATLTTQNLYGKIEMTAAQTISTDAAAGNMLFYTTGTTAAGSPVERMRIDQTGNVGIGTTAPGVALQIGDLNSVNRILQIGSVGNTYATIETYGSTGEVRLASNNAASSDTFLTFYTADAGTEGEKVRITKAGNVGIGTTAPASLLSVGSSSQFVVNSSGYIGIGTTNPNDYAEIGGGVTIGSSYLGAGTTAPSNGLLVQGNVGIGKTNPSYNLDVNGSLGVGSTAYFASLVGIGTTAPTYKLDVVSSSTTGLLNLTGDSITTGIGINLSLDGLTTGKGIYLESTSIALTTGNLMNLYWNPSGSTEIFATGDLFKLNVGQYGNLGNIMALYDNGSDVFKVSQTQITSAVPHSFTAAGDVSMAYDLAMTNQTSSNIKSYGPLTIETGESWESNNLTLKTYNSGKLILDIAGGNLWTDGTNVGIGTTNPGNKLAVSGGVGIGTTAANSLYLTTAAPDGGLIVEGKVGIGTTNPGSNTMKIVGSLCVKSTDAACAGSTAGAIYATTTTVQSADYAEMYVSSDALQPGQLVALAQDGNNEAVVLADANYSSLAGVVSTNPGVIINSDAKTDGAHPYKYPIALLGRAPVLISSQSPAIKAGDMLTLGDEPGRAVKATSSGQVIGRALEDWTANTGKDSVMTYINLSWYDPALIFASSGDLEIRAQADSSYQVVDTATGSIIDQIGAFAKGIFGSLNSGSIIAQDISLSGVNLNTKLSDISGSVLGMKENEASLEAKLKDVSQSFTDKAATLSARLDDLFVWKLETNDKIASMESRLAFIEDNVLGASSSARLQSPEAIADGGQATLSALLVTGRTNLNDLGVIGTISAGTLIIDGADNSINSLAGALQIQPTALSDVEFMGGKAQLDTKGNLVLNEGHLVGNDSFRDRATLTAGTKQLRITRDWDSLPTTVMLTATYNTRVWVEQITTTGFTIKVDTAPTADADIQWLALW